MATRLKFYTTVLGLGVSLAVFGGPWALYWLGLSVVHGKPVLPHVIAPEAQRLAIWEEARGVGEPELRTVNPYTYVPLSIESGPPRTSLLLAWWVATEHYDQNRRYKGNIWRQLSCGALSVWLTNAWSIEQLLSKVIEQRGKRTDAPSSSAESTMHAYFTRLPT
jgi:hypothetical protein